MTTQEKLIKAKLNLLELGEYLGNVSEACRTLGYSRDTFYRVKKLFEEGGSEALREVSRRKPNMRNRVPEATEKASPRVIRFPAVKVAPVPDTSTPLEVIELQARKAPSIIGGAVITRSSSAEQVPPTVTSSPKSPRNAEASVTATFTSSMGSSPACRHALPEISRPPADAATAGERRDTVSATRIRANPQRSVPPFLTWVALSELARPAARRRVIRDRRAFLEAELARERDTLAEVSRESTDDRVTRITRSMVEQVIRQIELELDWLDELEVLLES